MMIRFFAPLSVSIALSACAPTAGVYQNTPTASIYQNQIEELRTHSLNIVRIYASETRLFFDKNGQEKTIAAAQDSVKRGLKDPDSAKFQNLRIANYNNGKVVCGEINTKNSYGGYVGYERFVAGISGAEIFDKKSDEDQNINDAYNAGINEACGY